MKKVPPMVKVSFPVKPACNPSGSALGSAVTSLVDMFFGSYDPCDAVEGGEDQEDLASLLAGLQTIAIAERQTLEAIVNPPLPTGTKSPAHALLRWILWDGRWQYPWLRRRFSSEVCHRMACRLELPADRRGPLTHFMNLIWTLEPRLQEAFPLLEEGQPEAYGAWFVLNGLREYRLFDLATPTERRFLLQPDPVITDPAPIPMTRFLGDIWRERLDLMSAFDVFTPEGRLKFFQWFLLVGVHEYRCYEALSSEHIRILAGPMSAAVATSHGDLPLLLYLIWDLRPDVQKLCPLESADSTMAIRRWFWEHGRSEYGATYWPSGLLSPLRPDGPMLRKTEDHIVCIQSYHGHGGLPFPQEVRRVQVEVAEDGETICSEVLSAALSSARVAIWDLPNFDAARLMMRNPFALDHLTNVLVLREGTVVPPVFDEVWSFGEQTCKHLRERTNIAVRSVVPWVEPPEPKDIPLADLRRKFSRPIICIPMLVSQAGNEETALEAVKAVGAAFPPDPDSSTPKPLIIRVGTFPEGQTELEEVVIEADMMTAQCLVAASDLLVSVMPALHFDILAAAAMASQVPVIALGDEGRSEFLSDETGFPVEATDQGVCSDTLAKLIATLYKDPKDSKKRSTAANRYISMHYSLQASQTSLIMAVRALNSGAEQTKEGRRGPI